MPYTGPDCLKTLTKLKQLERQQDILPLPGLHWHWHCKQHKYLWATNRGQSRPGKEKLLTLILLASFYLEELSTRPESEGSLTTETRGWGLHKKERCKVSWKFKNEIHFFVKTRRFFIFKNLPQLKITKKKPDEHWTISPNCIKMMFKKLDYEMAAQEVFKQAS